MPDMRAWPQTREQRLGEAIDSIGATGLQSRGARGWIGTPMAMRIAAALAAALVAQAWFALADISAGLPLVREQPARLDASAWIQTAIAFSVSALFVAALVAARSRSSPFERVSTQRSALAVGSAVLLLALAATLLVVFEPTAFHDAAQEDRALEWVSAGLLFAGAVGLAAAALRHCAGLERLVAIGLALALFLLGMEEISWMQRVFGFATPGPLAAANWQGEFNLHNIQTDLSEFAYYVGAGLFLVVLPLVGELLSPTLRAHRMASILPGRMVAAVAAPAAIFTYGQWDLFAMQCVTMLTLAVLAAFAQSARRRGDRAESLVYLLWLIGVAGGQALMLAYGSALIDVPDPTEYREFFIAAGFAAYGWTVARSAWRA